LTLTRLRLGYIIGFIIAVLLVGLGVYSVYYFFTFAHERSNYLFGGLGIPVFGYVLIRATYPIFVPLKKELASIASCPYCGAVLKEDATVCEKCKQQIDTSNIKN
jgi:ribosomal protein L40E